MLKQLNRKVVDAANQQNQITNQSLRQIQFPSFLNLAISTQFNYQRTISPSQTYTMPLEPDGNRCTVLLELTAVGDPIPDQSGFGNDANLSLNSVVPDLTEGKPGIYRPAFKFNGLTEWYFINESPSIKLSTLTSGFSIFLTCKPMSFDVSGSGLDFLQSDFLPADFGTTVNYQIVAAKFDDANNMWAINLGTDGTFRAGVIYTGVETKARSSTVATLGSWYDIVISYNTADKSLIFCVNNNSSTQAFAAGDSISYPTGLNNNTSLNIGRGNDPVSRIFGKNGGAIQFFRYYRNPFLSPTEIANLYNNKWTIENISTPQAVAKFGENSVV